MMRGFMTALTAATMAALAATAYAADDWSKLVAPAELEALAAEGDVTVVDIRDEQAYLTANIPGSLNAPYPAWRGPAKNPGQTLTDEQLTALMQYLGLTPDSRVVVSYAGVNQTDFGAAARVYWTLKSAGLTEIAILNGGVRSWISEGKPLSVAPSKAEPSTAKFALAEEWKAERADVAAIASGSAAGKLVDARPDPFLKGDKKHPAAAKSGTLSGAQGAHFAQFFDGEKTQLPASNRVAALVAAAGVEKDGDAPIVSFCNTGHWAATNWFALSEMAGIEGVKLYPESMVGWTGAGGETVKTK
ncbi:MAG: sulfurtransferase [Rhodobacteraceae bacterium]|nr:sulfurtransferase [Paracoccaceae bacterium]